MLTRGNSFCQHCGKFVMTVPPWPVKAGKCGYCAADLIRGDRFCRKCGKDPSKLPLFVRPPVGNLQSVKAQPPAADPQPVKKGVEPWSSAKMIAVTFSISEAILLADLLIEGRITREAFWLACLFVVIGISGAYQNRKQAT